MADSLAWQATWIDDKTATFRILLEGPDGQQSVGWFGFLNGAQVDALHSVVNDLYVGAPSEPCAYAKDGQLYPWSRIEPEHDHRDCLDTDAATSTPEVPR